MKVCFNRKFSRAEKGRKDHVKTAPSLKLAEDTKTREWGSDFSLDLVRSMSCNHSSLFY